MPAQLISRPSQSVSRRLFARSLHRSGAIVPCATGSSHGMPACAATEYPCDAKKAVSAATTSGRYAVIRAKRRSRAAPSAASTASMVVTDRMPVAAAMRRLISAAPTAMDAAVQLNAIRSTLASARSWAWLSMPSTNATSSSSRDLRKRSRVVRNWTPAGAMSWGSWSHSPPDG